MAGKIKSKSFEGVRENNNNWIKNVQKLLTMKPKVDG
jgi:hypothetical protein